MKIQVATCVFRRKLMRPDIRLLLLALAMARLLALSPAHGQSAGMPSVIHNSGHSSIIKSIAFSPNGRWVASSSDDAAIKLWDVASGRLLRTLVGHASQLNSIDGRWLVSDSSDDGSQVLAGTSSGKLKLWQKATGRLIRTFEPNGKSENACSSFIPTKSTTIHLLCHFRLTKNCWLWACTTVRPSTSGIHKRGNSFGLWKAILERLGRSLFRPTAAGSSWGT